MKSTEEIQSVIGDSKVMGPLLRTTAEDLLKKYNALRSAFIAETDGRLDIDQCEKLHLKDK